MKVLHIYKTYVPDNFTGVPRVIWEIAQGLSSKGVQSTVLALSQTPQPNPIKVADHWVHQANVQAQFASTGLSLSVISQFRRLVSDADLVHYHFPWPMADLMHLLVRPSCPSVITYHSDVVRQKLILPFYRPLMNWFLGAVDRVVATSDNYARSSPVLSHLHNNLITIPIGLSDRKKPDDQRVQKWRDQVGEAFFLFVGAPRYYKGLQFLMEASRLSGRKVVIAGGDDPIDLVNSAPANVSFVGEISDEDREALLDLCVAFVLPSHLRSEAYGLVLVEAARAAKPMISCEIDTGTSFVNQNGITGLTVPPADAAALASAMDQLAANADQAREMGAAARKRYATHLQANRMCGAYLDLYRELVPA